MKLTIEKHLKKDETIFVLHVPNNYFEGYGKEAYITIVELLTEAWKENRYHFMLESEKKSIPSLST